MKDFIPTLVFILTFALLSFIVGKNFKPKKKETENINLHSPCIVYGCSCFKTK